MIRFITWLTAASAIALAPVVGWDLPGWWALLALAVAVHFGEPGAIRIVIGRQSIYYGLVDIFVAYCFVVAPGSWIAVGLTVGILTSQSWNRPWFKTSFNVAVNGLSVMLGLLLVQGIGGVFGACVGAMACGLFTYLLVSAAVSISSGEPYRPVVVAGSPVVALQAVGNTSVGALGGWLALQHQWVGLLGLVAPLIALWTLYRQMTQRSAEARLFEELAKRDEQVRGRSVDVSARVIVAAAARAFGGAGVELLIRHPDGPLRYLGDERGVALRERVDGFGSPWVLGALAGRRVRTGADAGRPFLTAVLGDAELPLACLRVKRPLQSGAFTRSDERLAHVLVRQAETWLSVADLTTRHDEAVVRAEAFGAASRVLGDIGEDTTPAVAVLRESVNRLSRLADALDSPDDVAEIVNELHSVERAVAALLGAVRLASERRAPTPLPGAPAGPSDDTEWTSTGQLTSYGDQHPPTAP